MAVTNEEIERLKQRRADLVMKRRIMATHESPLAASNLADIQRAIDAVDRAIVDEESGPASRLKRG